MANKFMMLWHRIRNGNRPFPLLVISFKTQFVPAFIDLVLFFDALLHRHQFGFCFMLDNEFP